MIIIKGLDKAEVLRVLYDNAVYFGGGQPMSLEEARELLSTNSYFDYIKGRTLKISLNSDIAFDERQYDLVNGLNSARRVIDALRSSKKKGEFNKFTFKCPKCGKEYDILDYLEPGDMEGTFPFTCDDCSHEVEVEFSTTIKINVINPTKEEEIVVKSYVDYSGKFLLCTTSIYSNLTKDKRYRIESRHQYTDGRPTAFKITDDEGDYLDVEVLVCRVSKFKVVEE